jgi:hypothetical protein
MVSADPLLPKDVSDLDIAFGGINGLMPAMDSIPKEFHRGAWSNKLFSDWFYAGLKSLELTPKEGIDKTKAMRHIRAIMGSFEPKHEHKEAAVAYLLDQWFEPGKWERKEIKL